MDKYVPLTTERQLPVPWVRPMQDYFSPQDFRSPVGLPEPPTRSSPPSFPTLVTVDLFLDVVGGTETGTDKSSVGQITTDQWTGTVRVNRGLS